MGWTGRQDKHDDGVTLATIKFAWADDKPGEVTIKPVSTILVGATPEFEVAALSLAPVAVAAARLFTLFTREVCRTR